MGSFLQMKAWGLERWPDLLKVTQRGEGFSSGLSGSCYHITQEVSPYHPTGRNPNTVYAQLPSPKQGAQDPCLTHLYTPGPRTTPGTQ